MAMMLSSSAFSNGTKIPVRYTCDGENISPPLSIYSPPTETVSLALIMDDPDIPREVYPNGGTFDHFVVFNIPADITEISEGKHIGIMGVNSKGKESYTGPCPPPQYEPKEHRYFFRLYALDTMLSLKSGVTKDEVLFAMKGHTLATSELMGRYSRVSID